MSKKSDWLKAYAECMQQHIIGGFPYQYCYDCALASMEMVENDDQIYLDQYDPCDACMDEMECWDD